MKNLAKILFLLLAAYSLSCGVKGDPVPPGTPAELGRGRPQTKPLKTLQIPNPSRPPEEEGEPSED